WQGVEVRQERWKIGWMLPAKDTVGGGGFLQLAPPPPPPPPPPPDSGPLPAQPASASARAARRSSRDGRRSTIGRLVSDASTEPRGAHAPRTRRRIRLRARRVDRTGGIEDLHGQPRRLIHRLPPSPCRRVHST